MHPDKPEPDVVGRGHGWYLKVVDPFLVGSESLRLLSAGNLQMDTCIARRDTQRDCSTLLVTVYTRTARAQKRDQARSRQCEGSDAPGHARSASAGLGVACELTSAGFHSGIVRFHFRQVDTPRVRCPSTFRSSNEAEPQTRLDTNFTNSHQFLFIRANSCNSCLPKNLTCLRRVLGFKDSRRAGTVSCDGGTSRAARRDRDRPPRSPASHSRRPGARPGSG